MKRSIAYVALLGLFLLFSVTGCGKATSVSKDKAPWADKGKAAEVEEKLSPEDRILGRYICNRGAFDVYKDNGQLMLGESFSIDDNFPAVFREGKLSVAEEQLECEFKGVAMTMNQAGKPMTGDPSGSGPALVYYKQFSINPSMDSDSTLPKKFAGKWIYENGGKHGILTIISEGKRWILIDDSGRPHALKYQNGAMYCLEDNQFNGYLQYDPSTNNLKVEQDGEYGYFRKVYSIRTQANTDDIRKSYNHELDQQLFYAAGNEAGYSLVQALLQAGADPNARYKGEDKIYSGCTVLMIATDRGAIATIQLLLEAGAKVNAKTTQGYTALMLAAEGSGEEELETVKELVKAGADVNARDNNGKSVLGYATDSAEIRDFLKRSGARE